MRMEEARFREIYIKTGPTSGLGSYDTSINSLVVGPPLEEIAKELLQMTRELLQEVQRLKGEQSWRDYPESMGR